MRSVEVVYACDEALHVIAGYQEPERPFEPAEPKLSEGFGCTEAPRGLLFHRYRLDENGGILEAQIVPPTAQNQPSIEADLKELVGGWLDLPADTLRERCEQTIRNYDPCISCATHFLKLDVRHE